MYISSLFSQFDYSTSTHFSSSYLFPSCDMLLLHVVCKAVYQVSFHHVMRKYGIYSGSAYSRKIGGFK